MEPARAKIRSGRCGRRFNVSPLTAVFPPPRWCIAEGEHQHDSTVTSVGIEFKGDLDVGKAQKWLSELLQEKGVDIFRSKVSVQQDLRRSAACGIFGCNVSVRPAAPCAV